ncbi:uncharacterized protein NEPG_01499 [Nematocida parisii ERTm1]|uniref:uncharacterized protein n=1 Tax=Nematocida parisii (strain ERTm1 / ATCC PRA-289) TaxID=881290 RepID=UPI000264B88F|nr:uncharacterized protein NEPG_01499 [Nematocida parisii ERTm1]EIJ93927.1 hypothetical protein NEPG_01499 [Nematocida parisii ERTm1]|eukprot:XP_013059327.1 hypothetical protein NEPG_01499 [Nematocida parisii ERTm1]
MKKTTKREIIRNSENIQKTHINYTQKQEELTTVEHIACCIKNMLKLYSMKSILLFKEVKDNNTIQKKQLFYHKRNLCKVKAIGVLGIMLCYMLFGVKADLGFSKLKELQETRIKVDGGTNLIINPCGSLNLLRGNIYRKSFLISNKRLFDPYLSINHKLKQIGDNNNIRYLYERIEENDIEYTIKENGMVWGGPFLCDMEKNIFRKYISQYHNKFLKMFSIIGSDVDVETDRMGSMGHFLCSEQAKHEKEKILASLLLLSEGINLPIKIEKSINNYYITLPKKNGGSVIFQVAVPIENMNTKDSEENLQPETIEIIKFFIQYRNFSFLKEDRFLAEPTTLESFESGNFLNSPWFLIQAYISGLIDDMNSANALVLAVYDIISEYIQTSPEDDESYEYKAHKMNVFNRLFSPEKNLNSSMKYINTVEAINKKVESTMVIPLYRSSNATLYGFDPLCRKKMIGLCYAKEEDYENETKQAILGLLCCLLYDPDEQEYTTEHLENCSEELREFFKKYNKPSEKISSEACQAWNNIISDRLENRNKVKYENHLAIRGSITILYLIKELTNTSPESWENEFFLLYDRNSHDVKFDEKFSKDLDEYVTRSFMKVSRNKNLSIFVGFKTDEIPENKIKHTYIDIDLRYEANNRKQLVYLTNNGKYAEIFAGSPHILDPSKIDTNRYFEKLKDRHVEDTEFISFLISNYINQIIQNSFEMDDMVKSLIIKNKSIIASKYNNINTLLISGCIQSINYACFLISICLLSLQEENVSEDHPMIRLTSNILGTKSLQETQIQAILFPPIFYTGLYKTNYPNIMVGIDTWRLMSTNSDSFYFFICVSSARKPDIMEKALNMYIYLDKSNSFSIKSPFYDKRVNLEIFRCLFQNGETKYAKKVIHTLQRKYDAENKFSISNTIVFIWFIYSCYQKTPFKYDKVIIELFLLLKSPMVSQIFFYIKEISNKYPEVLDVLNGLKEEMKTNERRNMVSSIIALFDDLDSLLTEYKGPFKNENSFVSSLDS